MSRLLLPHLPPTFLPIKLWDFSRDDCFQLILYFHQLVRLCAFNSLWCKLSSLYVTKSVCFSWHFQVHIIPDLPPSTGWATLSASLCLSKLQLCPVCGRLKLALLSLSLWPTGSWQVQELGVQEAIIPTALTQVPVGVEGNTPPGDVHDHVLGGHLKAAS